MKSIIIALCALNCAYAVVEDKAASVVRSEFNSIPEGPFNHVLEIDNGIVSEVHGIFKPTGDKDIPLSLEVQGSNTFTSPEGQVFKVTYIANENGYQPQGDHLPTTPEPVPIPEYIQRALAYIEEHPYSPKP